METQTEKMVRYLDDAWAVEKALVKALDDMAEEANDPEVRAMFQEHRALTHQQEEALEARIRALGEEPSGGKGFFNQMVAKIGDAMSAAHDDYDKTTQNLMKAYGTEHFECAMYESLLAYATAIGDTATAELATLHQQQERQTAERIWPLIAPVAARAADMAQARAA
jgi:ferritin-like metal-binding protein YciE